MYSIYHFFAHLYRNRNRLEYVPKLGDFPFDRELLSYRGKAKFPDFAIRVNPHREPTGGELIEAKDSQSYSIPSFNSTIPTGRKSIESLVQGKSSVMRKQMEEAGDDIYSLTVREVYYLLRGKEKKTGNTKICLVHGSFFETISVEELIKGSFDQVIADGLDDVDVPVDNDVREVIDRIAPLQSHFSKSRHVKDASVTLRFRVMTEAATESNILNSQQYPQIKDNTINLVIPNHPADDFAQRMNHLRQALATSEWEQAVESTITHPFNGDFFVLSYAL